MQVNTQAVSEIALTRSSRQKRGKMGQQGAGGAAPAGGGNTCEKLKHNLAKGEGGGHAVHDQARQVLGVNGSFTHCAAGEANIEGSSYLVDKGREFPCAGGQQTNPHHDWAMGQAHNSSTAQRLRCTG